MNKTGLFQGFGLFIFPGPPSDEWVFGWLTGRDSDLVCVKPNLVDPYKAQMALSPASSNLLLAVMGFLLKSAVLVIDRNFLSPDGTPNKGVPG